MRDEICQVSDLALICYNAQTGNIPVSAKFLPWFALETLSSLINPIALRTAKTP